MMPEKQARPTGREDFGLVGRRAQGWRIVAAVLGLLDFAAGRNTIFADGISYLEIARNYAAGNWHLAVNAYWSPLYSWLLALLRIVETGALGLNPAHTVDTRERLLALGNQLELSGMHVLNLAAYAAAWVAFERFLARVDRLTAWKSEESRSAFVFAACYTFLCFALFGIGNYYPCPDFIVLALFLWSAAILMDIRVEPFQARRIALLGVVVAVAYLTKTAMLPGGLCLIASAVLLSRGSRVRTAVTALVSLAALSIPWIVAVRAHEGRWTIGESGKMNYAWEVDGAAHTFHWQGEPGDVGTPLHPTRKVMSDPVVYEFATPIQATYPPWYDPAYWYAGIAPPLKPHALMRNFLSHGQYALFLLVVVPGLPIAAIAAIAIRRFRASTRALLGWWNVIGPAAAIIVMYCCVFLDRRYIAGPLVAIGTLALAAFMGEIQNRVWTDLIRIQTVVVSCFLLAPTVLLGVRAVCSPSSYTTMGSEQIGIAEELRRAGLAEGDRIGYVGVSINAYWALCDGVRIVAELPVTAPSPRSLPGDISRANADTDRFWLGGGAYQQPVIAAMRRAGAKAIVADYIPGGADLSGWQVLNAREPQFRGRDRVAVRFLDR